MVTPRRSIAVGAVLVLILLLVGCAPGVSSSVTTSGSSGPAAVKYGPGSYQFSITPGALLPADWPPTIPVPAGLTLYGTGTTTLNTSVMTTAVYSGSGSPAAAIAAYTSTAESAGWRQNPIGAVGELELAAFNNSSDQLVTMALQPPNPPDFSPPALAGAPLVFNVMTQPAA